MEEAEVLFMHHAIKKTNSSIIRDLNIKKKLKILNRKCN